MKFNMKVNLLNIGSSKWIAQERENGVGIVAAETEEFSFSARNEFDWLNEHMAEIFSENQVNVAEIFKTPGKLRGKTPRTARKINSLEVRVPLSDVFSATPKGAPSPFRRIHFERPAPTFQVAEDEPDEVEQVVPSTSKAAQPSPPKQPYNTFDSGYYGSQLEQATQVNEPLSEHEASSSIPEKPTEDDEMVLDQADDGEENVEILGRDSDLERRTTERSFQSAKEEQPRNISAQEAREEEIGQSSTSHGLENSTRPILESPLQSHIPHPPSSPQKRSPEAATTVTRSPLKEMQIDHESESPEPMLHEAVAQNLQAQIKETVPEEEDEPMDDVQSPSDGSSPIRPIVRKSSLNFASLPAREPLTTKKSIGNRVSRTSHLEQSRTSYYGRLTGGKSIGNSKQDREVDVMDVYQSDGQEDDQDDTGSIMTRLHNKTSTQRLQDQISMLGQSNSNLRPSKSLVGNTGPQPQPPQITNAIQEVRTQTSFQRKESPQRNERPPPGAFPEDEDESWIGPPPAAAVEPCIFSPRQQMQKSHSTDVMEDIYGKDNIGGSQFDIPKRGEQLRNLSPAHEPVAPERTLAHVKSASTSMLRSPKKASDDTGSKKGISVSNPNPSIHSIEDETSTSPPKSPARSQRGSPLKTAKDKFSSILKSSRGLFASSAAVSAEAKTSALSPPSSRMGLKSAPSFEDVLSQSNNQHSIYPSIDSHNKGSQLSFRMPESPFKPSARKTRASTEREERRKEEEAKEAREAKEAKEAQKMDQQLEKARNKVREDAHRDHIEQERTATKQRELAARKELEAEVGQVDLPRETRTSPRKTKAQLEAEGIAAAAASADELAKKDIEMAEASQAMPPPAIPRPKSQIGRPQAKRPLKPAKESVTKVKPPTVIRVDTGSQRGHQYHPSNATLAATLQESLGSSQQSAPSQGLRHKASTSSLQSKSSTSSFKSAATKALEAAAKKKEQDELAARQRREAKHEMERQRAAIKDEEKRVQEAEKQRERERQLAHTDAKKTQALEKMEKRKLEMERAKQTRAPPPAARPQQPSADLTHAKLQDKALPPIPPQRPENPPRAMRMNTAIQRPQEDSGRPAMHHSSAKAPPKRPLPQEPEEHYPRPAIQWNGPSYQNEHQSKRRRTSESFNEDDEMADYQPKMTAPPIRQSSSRQKEFATKSLFPSGYANAPPPGNSLQRSTLISQHNLNQSRPAHPMDMAQVSKAPIAFASSSSQANTQQKTPAGPGAGNGVAKSAKSVAKSSPKYQNGENIVLPEIHTDSEDEDSDAGDFPVQSWTNSPDLRRQLLLQETIDPAEIFGRPGPLNMEEVFSKSKDRFHKFRTRTSSANWSGSDRLTEDDIRKDLEARDKVRRQGGWTYDSMV